MLFTPPPQRSSQNRGFWCQLRILSFELRGFFSRGVIKLSTLCSWMIQWTLIDTGSWIPAQQREEKLQRLWNVHWCNLFFIPVSGWWISNHLLFSECGRGALWQGTEQQLALLSEARSKGITGFIGGRFNTFPLGLAYFYMSKLSSQNRARGRG